MSDTALSDRLGARVLTLGRTPAVSFFGFFCVFFYSSGKDSLSIQGGTGKTERTTSEKLGFLVQGL